MQEKPKATNCVYCNNDDIEYLRRDKYGFEYYVCNNKECTPDRFIRDEKGVEHYAYNNKKNSEEGFMVAPPEAIITEEY